MIIQEVENKKVNPKCRKLGRIMTIIEWFDPVNIEHLQAYKGISEGLYWPKDLLPKDIEFPVGWFSRIESQLANLYIEEKLKIGK